MKKNIEIKKVKYKGELDLAGFKLPCYVLEDGTRVLSGRKTAETLKMVEKGSKKFSGKMLGINLARKSLKPFIDKEKGVGNFFKPIICYGENNKIHGYEATILVDICRVYSKASREIHLSSRQKIIANQCIALLETFAKVGIIALVDEATGYQTHRPSNELSTTWEKELKSEPAPSTPKNISNRGLVVAELVNKRTRTDKLGQTFYTLEISIRKTITERVLDLRNEKPLMPANSKEDLFVFTNEGRNRFAYTLEKGSIYAFWFTKRYNLENKKDYFQVKDWRKLGDKRSIERTLNLVSNQNSEEILTVLDNKEILKEVRRRLKENKISFQISAVNSDDEIPLELDTDLKDEKSGYRVDLQENKEK